MSLTDIPDGNDDAVLFIVTGQPAWTALQDTGNDGSGGRYLGSPRFSGIG